MTTLPESPFEKQANDPVLKDMLRIAGAASNLLGEYFEKTDLEINEKTGPHDLVTEADFAVDALITDFIHEHYPNDAIFSEESGKNDVITSAEYVWVIDPLDGTNNFASKNPLFGAMICRGRNVFADGVDQTSISTIEYAVIASPTLELTAWAKKGEGTWLNDKKVNCDNTISFQDAAISWGVFRHQEDGRQELYPGEKDLLQFEQLMQSSGKPGHNTHSAAAALLYLLSGKTQAHAMNDMYEWDFAPVHLLAIEAGFTVARLNGNSITWNQPQGGHLIALQALHAEIRELLQHHV